MYGSEDYVKNEEAETGDEDMDAEGEDGNGRKLDMPSALRIILNNGGRKVSSKAKQVSKDAYLGFLLLRHLRIRDLRNKVWLCVCVCVCVCEVKGNSTKLCSYKNEVLF